MNQLFASAVQCMQTGQLAEAERLCREILATAPDDVPSIHLLGFVAYKAGRPNDAIDLIGRAIALDETNPDCHFNIGLALLAAGRAPEAVTHFNRATALKPDYATAVANLVNLNFTYANQALEQGRLDEAGVLYQRTLALKPDFAEAHSNLGVVFMALGHPADAAAAYRRAIEINPNLATVHRNLGRALLMQGDVAAALAASRRALAIAQTDDVKTFFVECVRAMSVELPASALDGIEPLLARALTEGWGRPDDMAAAVATIVRRKPAADDLLLRALLETAPVPDIALEHWLTLERRRLLIAHNDDGLLPFACALARQCFINDYVFAHDAEESRRAEELRDAVAAGAHVGPLQLAVLAAYVPLHALPNAEALLARAWPAPLEAVLDQQIRAPRQEHDDRDHVPVLTAIDDEVSQAVRAQYEEMPYPRWVQATQIGAPVAIDQHLRAQFRPAPLRPLNRTSRLDILVAGCGTGGHPIETARRYAGAQVLAIDLSLTSLTYARRMTRRLGLTNIDYAQADILKLGAGGRSFDVIEAVGVLHHLADPLAGLRVLTSLLRPNGLMLLGLYSKFARREITLAREFIAERGFGHTADDIRRCRQELMALDDAAPLKQVTRFWDFYTTSTCRDLIFHVQEHQFSISDIKAFLAANGLTFIGFVIDPAVQQLYRSRFAGNAAMTDLDGWHTLEQENPPIFAGMYQFWVQK